MYFEESGNTGRPAMVFIHGGGMAGWAWRKQVEHFSDFHCIVPDLPEHGKSRGEGPLSLADAASRIAGLIEARAADGKAHVVGHSLGGKVVVELLAQRPEVVDHAVVASALFGPTALLRLIHRPFVYRLYASMMRSKRLRSLVVKQFGFPERSYVQNSIEELRRLTADALYRTYDQLYQYQRLPVGLASANVPTLVMAGEKEPGAMKASVTSITEALPDSKGILIKGADHTYPWAMFDVFNKLVRNWISDQGTEWPAPEE